MKTFFIKIYRMTNKKDRLYHKAVGLINVSYMIANLFLAIDTILKKPATTAYR